LGHTQTKPLTEKYIYPNLYDGFVEKLIVKDSCVGCAFCMLSCKFDAIEVIGKAQIDREKCTLCRRCLLYCPISALVIE